jgi:type III secretion system YscD/HrpQ family protein
MGESTGNRIILKVLNGLQSGAEVSLAPGEYSIGSGADDDIQLVDISLKPAHARLKVGGGKIQIAAGAGGLRSAHGLQLAAESKSWQEVEPLDVITAGTIRFALGPPTAQWTTIADAEGGEKAAAEPAKASATLPEKTLEFLRSKRGLQLAGPSIAVLLLTGWGAFHLATGGAMPQQLRTGQHRSDLDATRAAIAAFPFARNVEVTQEVDGTVFATGFVETLTERRAIVQAIERTEIPVRLRLQVRETLRNELNGLIKAEAVEVTYTLSDRGELVLEGRILDDAKAERFVTLVHDGLTGLHAIESRIRTAKQLLDGVQKLAKSSGIHETTSFMLNGPVVEATGAIPPDKVDAWVGFLQAYSRRFAGDIQLKSMVQLVDERGQLVVDANAGTPDSAILVGNAGGKGTVLDVDRLRQGAFDLGDVLVGAPKKQVQAAQPAKPPSPKPASAPKPVAAPDPVLRGHGLTFDEVVALAKYKRSLPQRQAPESLSGTAEALILKWSKGELGDHPDGQKLNAVLGGLAEKWSNVVDDQRGHAGSDESEATRQRMLMQTKLVPLLNGEASDPSTPYRACWPGAHIDTDRLPTALFWLDLLSSSDLFSLATFKKGDQSLILETALNPGAIRTCAKRIELATGVTLAALSLYLQEIEKNPEFIRFILRDYNPFPLEISGARVSGERFVQTRTGQKLREGAAPTGATRLSHIGELGVAIQNETGFSVIIYGPRLAWLSSAKARLADR